MDAMSVSTKTRMEYEEQFFDFSSDLLLNSIRDLFKDGAESGVAGAVKLLKKKLGPFEKELPNFAADIEEAFDPLKAEYEKGIEYALQKMGPKIQECFRVPDNVVCDEDFPAQANRSIDSNQLEEEISALIEECKNIVFMNKKIKEEIITADKTIDLLQKVNSFTPDEEPDFLIDLNLKNLIIKAAEED